MFIRWMVRRDIPRLYAIKDRFISLPEFHARLETMLRPRNSICMVVEVGLHIEAYCVYYLNGKQMDLALLELGTDGEMSVPALITGLTVGLTNKMSWKRECLTLWVDAYDLQLQLCLRDNGWLAMREQDGRIFFYWTDTAYFPICSELPEPDLQFAL